MIIGILTFWFFDSWLSNHIFSAYLERAIESALEAFQMYDVDPKDGRLTYDEIKPVSILFDLTDVSSKIIRIP